MLGLLGLRGLPPFSCATLVKLTKGAFFSFVNCKPGPSRLWQEESVRTARSFVPTELLGQGG